jgi:hypothetical protein
MRMTLGNTNLDTLLRKVHSDVMGPFPAAWIGGSKYLARVSDEFINDGWRL